MSKWLNNKIVLRVPYKKPQGKAEKSWNDFYKEFQKNDHMKPCHYTGFCVYGQLVEEFPIRTKANFRSCKVFGHECPVFYMAEPLAEEPKHGK